MTEMNKALMDKLRKLIAHEKSAREIGSLAEAEAFASKIQELMDEYKIGMSDVEFADREATEPIDFSDYSGPKGWKGGSGRRQYWTMSLARAIANANECQVVCGHGNRFCFVGRTSNREFCVVLFQYFFELGGELCEKACERNKNDEYELFNEQYDSYGEEWDGARKASKFRHWMKDYNKSWKAGFADAISTRLSIAQQKRDAAATKTGTIIHLRKDVLAVKSFMDDQEGFHKVHTGNRVVRADGYETGKRTGNSVNMTPHRLKPSRSSRLLLGA